MRLRQQAPHDPRGASGIDEIVDDDDAPAFAAGDAYDPLGRWFEQLELALGARGAVARHAHGLDDPQVELAGDDRGRHQAAARDAHDRLERARVGEPPGERSRVAMERVPGNREGFFGQRRRHDKPFGASPNRAQSACLTLASMVSTAALAAASRAGSRERTTMLVLGPRLSSKNG